MDVKAKGIPRGFHWERYNPHILASGIPIISLLQKTVLGVLSIAAE